MKKVSKVRNLSEYFIETRTNLVKMCVHAMHVVAYPLGNLAHWMPLEDKMLLKSYTDQWNKL